MLTQQAISGLTNLLICILLPCMAFDSFNPELTTAQLREAGLTLLISCGIGLLAVPIGNVLFRKFPDTKSTGKQKFVKMLCNPGVIAVALGICRMLFSVPVPVFLDTAIGAIGDGATVISLVTIGAILADVDVKSVLNLDTLYLSAVRLVLMPLLVLFACRVIGTNPLSSAVCVLMTGMPAGSMTAIFSSKYGADATFASKCIFVSTVISMFTIPIFYMLL